MAETNNTTTPNFPHPVLTKIHEPGRKPTRQSILTCQTELTANAASVDSVYSEHGHAFLTMTPLDFTALNGGVPFVMPVRPPMDPVHVQGATAAQITEDNRLHAQAWKAYTLMRQTQQQLRNQLLAAGDDLYFRAVKPPVLGYSAITVRQLLYHLFLTYGTFTEAERRQAATKMEQPWDGGPLETVILQLDQAQEAFANGGQAITNEQKRDKLYDLVVASGLMPDACQTWRMRPVAEKTWANAVLHFSTYADDRDELLTSGGAGYRANNVDETLLATSDALQDLHLHMANMAKRDDQKNSTIIDLTARLAAAKAALKAYNESANQQRRQRPGRNLPPATTNQRNKYCWSHGKGSHTGAECRNPRNGHIAAATATNTQGGNRTGLNG